MLLYAHIDVNYQNFKKPASYFCSVQISLFYVHCEYGVELLHEEEKYIYRYKLFGKMFQVFMFIV